jgi:hypothetical protein
MTFLSGAEVGAVFSTLGILVSNNIILFIMMFISYFIFYFYEFVHCTSTDSDIYEIDLVSSGVSSVTVALMLIGLDESSKGFSFANIDIHSQTTIVALCLVAYGFLLIFFGFTKILPRLLVIFLGNSELDFFINILAVLLAERIVVTTTMIFVILVPLALLFLSLRFRRMMHKSIVK